MGGKYQEGVAFTHDTWVKQWLWDWSKWYDWELRTELKLSISFNVTSSPQFSTRGGSWRKSTWSGEGWRESTSVDGSLAKTDEGRQESTRVQALANCLAASSYQSHCLFYASFDFFDIQRWLNSCPLSNLFSLIKYNLIALTEFEILLVLDLTFLQSVNKKNKVSTGACWVQISVCRDYDVFPWYKL